MPQPYAPTLCPNPRPQPWAPTLCPNPMPQPCALTLLPPGVSCFICSEYNPASLSPCAPRGNLPGILGRLTGDLFVGSIFVLFSFGDYIGRQLSG